MSKFLIVDEKNTSLRRKKVTVYLEGDLGEHKKEKFKILIEDDSDAYVRDNFASLFASGRSLSHNNWDIALAQANNLELQDVALAGIGSKKVC